MTTDATTPMTPTNVATLVTPNGMTLILDGKVVTLNRDHPNWTGITQALAEARYDALAQLLDIPAAIAAWTVALKDFGFTADGGLLALNGEAFAISVSDKAIEMMEAGAPPLPLGRFLTKLRENPSLSAQEETLLFAVANGFAIHEDGDIIAFKGVRQDYKDCHSGTFDNSVGQVITMPRHQVNDNREQTCSRGLHFGAKAHADRYGQRTMVVKVNPRDVVSVPNDYNNMKGRCCRYEVLAELERRETPAAAPVYTRDFFAGADTSSVVPCVYCGDDIEDCTCGEDSCDTCGHPDSGCTCCMDCENSPCTCEAEDATALVLGEVEYAIRSIGGVPTVTDVRGKTLDEMNFNRVQRDRLREHLGLSNGTKLMPDDTSQTITEWTVTARAARS